MTPSPCAPSAERSSSGVTFFDTAANYGAGHSERVLGRAFASQRDEVVIATKFGYDVDDATSTVRSYGSNEEDSDVAGHLRADLDTSLRRLDTDYVDVYQLHVGGLALARALEARDVLDDLVAAGKIRTYGWSTDRVDVIRPFATSPGCGVVQQGLSVLDDTNPELLALCEELDLASINRSPLGMGLLTGKFTADTTFPSNDQRHRAQWHPGFKDGTPTQDWLDQLAAIREVLTSNGRTLAQGALAWIWARSPKTIPIPGIQDRLPGRGELRSTRQRPADTRPDGRDRQHPRTGVTTLPREGQAGYGRRDATRTVGVHDSRRCSGVPDDGARPRRRRRTRTRPGRVDRR